MATSSLPITIGNVRYESTHGAGVVFVARPSSLGNPFYEGQDGTRDEVIAKYAVWLDEQLADPKSPAARKMASLRRMLKRHGQLHLLCWCHPLPCHAAIIRDRLLAVQP